MKLSNTLLIAILLGITVQTTSSCSDEDPKSKEEQEGKKKTNEELEAYDCPACGMG